MREPKRLSFESLVIVRIGGWFLYIYTKTKKLSFVKKVYKLYLSCFHVTQTSIESVQNRTSFCTIGRKEPRTTHTIHEGRNNCQSCSVLPFLDKHGFVILFAFSPEELTFFVQASLEDDHKESV